jgi:hypothetical protein
MVHKCVYLYQYKSYFSAESCCVTIFFHIFAVRTDDQENRPVILGEGHEGQADRRNHGSHGQDADRQQGS